MSISMTLTQHTKRLEINYQKYNYSTNKFISTINYFIFNKVY